MEQQNTEELSLHRIAADFPLYATVILPLALPKPYTFHVPDELIDQMQFGIRVEVQFGSNRRYAALVIEISPHAPDYETKPLLNIIDNHPIIVKEQLRLWQWIANYYACTMGEVMNAALPTNFKLSSQTKILLNPDFEGDATHLDRKEFAVTEALANHQHLTVSDIQEIIGQKTVFPLLYRLLEKGVLLLEEELEEKYKPKMIQIVRLAKVDSESEDDFMRMAFDKTMKSEKQTAALMAFWQLEQAEKNGWVKSQALQKIAQVDSTVLKAMQKKGIFELLEQEVSRLGVFDGATNDAAPLTVVQKNAIADIQLQFEEKNVVLLHGVTGSGKTRIYTELIQETIARGEQVLYLLPEIALTGQIIHRLQRTLGNDIGIYHSRMSGNERIETWHQVLKGKPVMLSARSGLFLPFSKLGLVIVDEEHDPSFKQSEPNPRYHARDTAIYLAHLQGAKVLLGSATPSLESYWNARDGQKYGFVSMMQRFAGLEMPEIELVDLRSEYKNKTIKGSFSEKLIKEIEQTLQRGEQVILFQNRRGYAPTLTCGACGWSQMCKNCDVTMTYHKFSNSLVCHYCGAAASLPKQCPTCGSYDIATKGFGTERIEDELRIFFPDAPIGRMDFDAIRTKNAHAKIINDFEEGRLNILVGTQMVTKGLDFDNVGLVGVLNADSLLHFPDFRAIERAFQLMVQVSGRAGRKNKQGKVMIQSFDITQYTLKDVQTLNYHLFFKRELQERQEFGYPPFKRLIGFTLKHPKPETVNEAAKILHLYLQKTFGKDRLMGPAVPSIPRIRGYYLIDFLLKLEKNNKELNEAKQILQQAVGYLQQQQGMSGVKIVIDVDM